MSGGGAPALPPFWGAPPPCLAWIAAIRSLFFILLVLMPRPPAICCNSGNSFALSEPRLAAGRRVSPAAAGAVVLVSALPAFSAESPPVLGRVGC